MALLITCLVLAFIFDYINGFHDAANSVATVVSTKILSPFQAVLWAATFNFVAFFIAKYIIGEFGIANTVAKVVLPQFVSLPVIFSGLLAAITWNLITWYFGIPSSSSHTLIGGFAGAAIMSQHAFGAVHLEIVLVIASFIVLAPLIGFTISLLLAIFTYWVCRRANPYRANKWFKKLHLFSSALFCVGHGLNDSQKVMGIIAAALFAAYQEGLPLGISDITAIPTWVPFGCFTVIALGTMSGGWRIIKTMGSRITKVNQIEGVVASTAGALTLFLTEILKIPVSTTHTITGSIIGVGAVKRMSAVRWGVTKQLLVAWILTIPVSALMGAGSYLLVCLFI